MNIHSIKSWPTFIVTCPLTGTVGGAVSGLYQRLCNGTLATALPLLGTAMNQASSLLLNTPLKYAPGVIGSLVAIVSTRICGEHPLDPNEKAQRTMAVAATIGLTVLPTIIEASGYAPVWASFDSLATAMTQGLALWYGAKAAALYGQKTISWLLTMGTVGLSALSYATFSTQVYGYEPAPKTVLNMTTGFAAIGVTWVCAKAISLLATSRETQKPNVGIEVIQDVEQERIPQQNEEFLLRTAEAESWVSIKHKLTVEGSAINRDAACMIPLASHGMLYFIWFEENKLCVQNVAQYDLNQGEMYLTLEIAEDYRNLGNLESHHLAWLRLTDDYLSNTSPIKFLNDCPEQINLEQIEASITADEIIAINGRLNQHMHLFTGDRPYYFKSGNEFYAAWYNSNSTMLNIQNLEDYRLTTNKNKLRIRACNGKADCLFYDGAQSLQARHAADRGIWLKTLDELVEAGEPSEKPEESASFQFKKEHWKVFAKYLHEHRSFTTKSVDVDDLYKEYRASIGQENGNTVICLQPESDHKNDVDCFRLNQPKALNNQIAITLNSNYEIVSVSLNGVNNQDVLPVDWAIRMKSAFRAVFIMAGDYQLPEVGPSGRFAYRNYGYGNTRNIDIEVIRESILFYPDYHLNELANLWRIHPSIGLKVAFKNLDFEREQGIDAGGPKRGYLNLLYSSICQFSPLCFHKISTGELLPQTTRRMTENDLGQPALLNDEEKQLYQSLGTFLAQCYCKKYLAGHQLAASLFRAVTSLTNKHFNTNEDKTLFLAEELLKGHKEAGMNVQFFLDKIAQYRQIAKAEENWWDLQCIDAGKELPLQSILETMAGTDIFPISLLNDNFDLDVNEAKGNKQAVLTTFLDFILRMSGEHGQLGRQIAPLLEMAASCRIHSDNHRDFYRVVQGSLNSPEKIANAISYEGNKPKTLHKVEVLKKAILDWDAVKLQKFVLWITDATNLPDRGELSIADAKSLFVHTCFSRLDLPNDEQSDEDFINMIEQEMVMNSYSAG